MLTLILKHLRLVKFLNLNNLLLKRLSI